MLAVFWNWEDVDPANEVSDQWFVAGLDCSGDGESYPGDTVQMAPGQRRIVNLYTSMAFPANKKIWVYVGLADEIWALLNDVSIDISIELGLVAQLHSRPVDMKRRRGDPFLSGSALGFKASPREPVANAEEQLPL